MEVAVSSLTGTRGWGWGGGGKTLDSVQEKITTIHRMWTSLNEGFFFTDGCVYLNLKKIRFPKESSYCKGLGSHGRDFHQKRRYYMQKRTMRKTWREGTAREGEGESEGEGGREREREATRGVIIIRIRFYIMPRPLNIGWGASAIPLDYLIQ